MPVNITSEIGPLESVLVHTPGSELEAVTPGNREDYLYDDIIELEIAQREHAGSCRCWSDSRGSRDQRSPDEILAGPDAREFLISRDHGRRARDALAQQLAHCRPAQSSRC